MKNKNDFNPKEFLAVKELTALENETLKGGAAPQHKIKQK